MATFSDDISDAEFLRVQRWLRATAGIHLSPAKKSMVASRLGKRLRELQCAGVDEYLQLLTGPARAAEQQIALDLLTTNETTFFREPRHFEFLSAQAHRRAEAGNVVRVWSAACSSGEEPYSIAIALDEALGQRPWDVVASDISMRMLERALSGIYPLERVKNVPAVILRKYFLRGTGPMADSVRVCDRLRDRIAFTQVNLNSTLPALGRFDVIFLRNVLIYFDLPTKIAVIHRVTSVLKPGGFLVVGHAESLASITHPLHCISPSLYLAPPSTPGTPDAQGPLRGSPRSRGGVAS